MVKGDDAVTRKRNKARRKTMQKREGGEMSKVSARVASLIAAKKRRLSGKRRKCQGMCFSLPTPEDPFNDRHGQTTFNENKKIVKKKTSKVKTAALKTSIDNKETNHLEVDNGTMSLNEVKTAVMESKKLYHKFYTDPGNAQIVLNEKKIGQLDLRSHVCENMDSPVKFFYHCLDVIEGTFHNNIDYDRDDKRLSLEPWGVEFLKCFVSGKNILETSGSSPGIMEIAWVVCMAAETMARREEKGKNIHSPFLLYLVSSQEEAMKVRNVCKPLKSMGIHTVSLHSGASLDHQIQGLKSCEPEYLVATPERLLELISLKAIDISRVSYLIVNWQQSLFSGGCADALNSIRQSISGNPFTVVFDNFHGGTCIPVLRNFLPGAICRLSLNNSITSQGSCIYQTVNVVPRKENRLPMAEVCMELIDGPLDVLFVVGQQTQSQNVVKSLKIRGYEVSIGSGCNLSYAKTSPQSCSGKKRKVTVVHVDEIGTADIDMYDKVFLVDFVQSIDTYVQILTRMARYTINGMLCSFLTKEDAPLAGQLIEILNQCGQAVPKALADLHLKSSKSVS